MKNFEEIQKVVQTKTLELVDEIETYIVCDINARFSIYLVTNEGDDILHRLTIELLGLVENVTAITIDGYIYNDLNHLSYLPPYNLFKNVYYVDRHIGLLNWDNTNKFKKNLPITCFYSFKGGLGRTTAMVLAAIHLARKGKKIVLLDFDLEAPGLASLFSADFPDIEKFKGVVDYLVDLMAIKYDQSKLDITEYYYEINRQDIVGSQGGELLIFPATIMDAEENTYLSKFSKLNSIFQINQKFPIDFLLNSIEKDIKPDNIFIDTRTGLNDLGAIFLTRYSTQSFLFFYGNRQNMFGLESLLPKLKEQNLNFYLVNSPVPQLPLAQEERDYFLERSYALFSDLYYSPENSPYIGDETAEHYPIEIPYNNLAVLLNSADKLKALADENSDNNAYSLIASILIGKKDENPSVTISSFEETRNLLEGLKSISPTSSAAEYEFMSDENLKSNFYPRKDYKFIFDKTKYLILGEKGAGKTALYAVLSHKEYAVALAHYCDANDTEMEATTWVKGLDKTKGYPSQSVFDTLTNENAKTCRNFWVLLLLQYISNALNLDGTSIELEWKFFIEESKQADSLDLEQKVEKINKRLETENKYITVIYDYLDVLIKEENGLRGKLISSLLEVWRDIQTRQSRLRSKIFMRRDIFDREVNLTDKVKLNNHISEIRWEYDQLLNIVWKRLFHSKVNLPVWLKTGIEEKAEITNELGIIPELQELENRSLLEKLLGEYMGGNNKAFPYNWILYHVSDTKRRIQPRSLLNLFSEAANRQIEEKDEQTRDYPLKPRNMEMAMEKVSEHRVQDIKEEYPLLKPIFDNLQSYHQQFPIDESSLDTALKTLLKQSGIEDIGISQAKRSLEDIGVLYEYKFTPKNKEKRYHIPDLYLIGMGLKRKGPGAHKALFGKK